MEIIEAISFLAISIIVVVLAFRYHIKLDSSYTEPPRFNGKVPDDGFSTFNNIGFSLVKMDFRFDIMTLSNVRYEFFCVFVPLIPLNCYRVKEEYTVKEKRGKFTTQYKIFGTEKWRLGEIIIIYAVGFGALAIFGSFINLVCVLYEQFA